MSKPKVARLLIREEMTRRLRSFSDDDHMADNFYELLARHADKILSGQKIARIIIRARMGYIAMLSPAIGDSKAVKRAVLAQVNQVTAFLLESEATIVEAMVDDPQVRKDAIAALRLRRPGSR